MDVGVSGSNWILVLGCVLGLLVVGLVSGMGCCLEAARESCWIVE